MPIKLTREDRITREKQRISRLTNPPESYFKLVFSHQIEPQYDFASLSSCNPALQPSEVMEVLKALGKFMDEATKMPITDVESTYKRSPYRSDATHDPVLNIDVRVEHFALYPSNTPSSSMRRHIDRVRVHGYFRVDNFIVLRLDWQHSFST
jgi:hypothetical protein